MNILLQFAFANELPQLLSVASIREKLDVSRSTFWRMRKHPDFPKSINITPTIERWKAEEIERWFADRR